LQPGLARVFGTVNYAENAEDMEVVRHVLDETISRHVAKLESLKTRIGG
jgi:hypothetical protein